MPFCRGLRRCACRFLSAARQIIFALRCCAASAAGIPTTSPKTPISAFASRASAIARRFCRPPPTRRRRRGSGRGSGSAPAGTKAGCRLGSCICADPVRLVRELTLAGALAFQLFLACNVLAALVHPVFMIGLCYALLAAPPLQVAGTMAAAPVFAATLVAGYVSTIAIDLIGLRRRGLARSRLGAGADAALLVAALARRLARAVSASVRPAALGEDRARAGQDFATLGHARVG